MPIAIANPATTAVSSKLVMFCGSARMPCAWTISFSYKLEEVIERDYDGLLVNASVLLISAGVFLIGLLQFGWLERVLIGFVLLIILGMSGAAELIGLNQIRSMQLTVFYPSGPSRKICQHR